MFQVAISPILRGLSSDQAKAGDAFRHPSFLPNILFSISAMGPVSGSFFG